MNFGERKERLERELCEDIRTLLQEFEKETGAQVRSVSVNIGDWPTTGKRHRYELNDVEVTI